MKELRGIRERCDFEQTKLLCLCATFASVWFAPVEDGERFGVRWSKMERGEMG
jgi:hypothetical protein